MKFTVFKALFLIASLIRITMEYDKKPPHGGFFSITTNPK